MTTRPAELAELKLVAEARLVDLFPAGGAGRIEASGVVTLDDGFLIVFDDSRNLGLIGRDLRKTAGNRVISPSSGGPVPWQGYEDVARDPRNGHFCLLVEAARHPAGGWQAKIEECDERFARLSDHWLPFPLPDSGKGMEGLTCVLRNGSLHLLAMCEGNRCRSGDEGRRPGGGRIQIFRPAADGWWHAGTIKLPDGLWFTDFAGVSVAGNRIVVSSQESAAVWVGDLLPDAWELADAGAVHEFPRSADRVVYCLVEGVCWIDDRRLVTVSDRAKPNTPGRCRDKQQSVQIFELPM